MDIQSDFFACSENNFDFLYILKISNLIKISLSYILNTYKITIAKQATNTYIIWVLINID